MASEKKMLKVDADKVEVVIKDKGKTTGMNFTKKPHEESKVRRLMAKRSRRINRKK